MKHGGEYARRLKKLYTQVVRKTGKLPPAEPTDPIEQLIIGILSGCTSLIKAQTIFRKLRQQVVDLNELRVTPPMELAEMIGDAVPLAREKAQRIVDSLNAIRRRQDSLELGFLKQRGRREAREYLESLEGVDRAAAASVVLYSLGGHAIPVDDLTLYVLQKEDVVDPDASPAEVQAFIERHVNASDARTFAEGLRHHVLAHAPRVPFERLPQLLKRAPQTSPDQNGRKPALSPVAAAKGAVTPAKPAAPAAAPTKAVANAKSAAPAAKAGQAHAAKASSSAPAAAPVSKDKHSGEKHASEKHTGSKGPGDAKVVTSSADRKNAATRKKK